MDAEQGKVFEVVCPCCRSVVWVDATTGGIVKSERAVKKKESLDELRIQEKQKKDGVATKFEATADREKKKRELAKEKFARAFGSLDEDGSKTKTED